MSDQALTSKPQSGALAGPLAEVAQTAAQLGKASKSANTQRAYDGDWRSFRA